MKENEQQILDRIADINERLITAKEVNAELRQELADAIREAKDAGIRYLEIGKILGIGKTGVSSILARNENES